MKVTQVGIRPTEDSINAERPALTPELLAASGARYSRNNEGLQSILDRIDPDNLDKSVESIFRMIDYGHQSIADMVPVAMFIDDISIWLAYYIWALCPTAGGQESSTRYVKLAMDEVLQPEDLGIPEEMVPEWRSILAQCFDAYQAALAMWEDIATAQPSVSRIPRSLLDDPSDKARKQVARMKRNYGFDRARYFLPAAAATNMMMIMSARGWVQLCQNLLSHPLPEPQRVGKAIRAELCLAAPRMIRHAVAKESFQKGIEAEFKQTQRLAQTLTDAYLQPGAETYSHPATPRLSAMPPEGISDEELAGALASHDNRYAFIGNALQRTSVRFGWDAVGFAEIRDLNRHRTGTKYAPMVPMGFYSADDQVPNGLEEEASRLHGLSRIGQIVTSRSRALLREGISSYLYWTVLGSQFPFEHTTTGDKFVYEVELRTGTGAHFRYANHLRNMLKLWHTEFPVTRDLILDGGAEPE